jgi:WD40 repeat protein
MTAGKLLHSLEDSSSSITSVCFNPSEFVLSSSSTDGTVRVYDLQKFELISSTSANNPGQVIFSPDGQLLLSANEDSLDLFEWEPVKSISSCKVNWHPTKDLQFLQDSHKLIACSTNGSFLDIVGFRLDVVSIHQTNSFDGEAIETRSVSPFVDVVPEEAPLLPPKTIKDSIQALTAATESLGIKEEARTAATDSRSDVKSSQITSKFKYVPVADGNNVLDIDLTTFLRGTARGQGKLQLQEPLSASSTSHDILTALSFRHSTVQGILNSKLHNIQQVREVWNESTIMPALEMLRDMADTSVILDVLRIINCKPKLINLEVATVILPLLNELLFGIYEE